jgi:hypothetical protein
MAKKTTTPPSYDQIAEAAYHRYLKRGGGDGSDFDDWVEAERELRARPSAPARATRPKTQTPKPKAQPKASGATKTTRLKPKM